MVWLICDITKLLTTLDPTYKKEEEEEEQEEAYSFWKEYQVRSWFPKQQQQQQTFKLQRLQYGGLWNYQAVISCECMQGPL